MRLGVFGGTFNPIHLAHLIVAERLLEIIGLDEILFIPSSAPPHKASPAADARHRLAMTQLAVASNPRFHASDVEVSRKGLSFTVDTLSELNRRQPGAEHFFIMGADTFRELATWKEPAQLLGLAHLVLIPRPGHPLDDPRRRLPPGVTPSGDPCPMDTGATHYPLSTGRGIFQAPVPLLEISSSDIRRRVGAGRSIRYLVPTEVESFIARHGLYTTRTKEVE